MQYFMRVVHPYWKTKLCSVLSQVDKCWQGAASDEFSCYSFETSNPTTWLEAKQACLEKGGRLVVMETDEEFDFIAEILRGNEGTDSCSNL
jgi:hypothetical protein